ncbi:hypothetical protein JCM39068_35630 [Desulfocastanea catecholica]
MGGLTQGKVKRCGGSAWESNPPNGLLTRYTGFEVRLILDVNIQYKNIIFVIFSLRVQK